MERPDPRPAEYEVRQAMSSLGEPLDTYHVFHGSQIVATSIDSRRVQQFFAMKRGRPVHDESRWPRCSVCNVAMGPEAQRHAQTPDGRVTRGHRWVKAR